MSEIRIIKVYSSKKRESIILKGKYEKSDTSFADACQRILKEHGVKNRGRFIVLQILPTGMYVSEYGSGIKFGKDRTIWLDNETVDILYKSMWEFAAGEGADAE